MVDFILFGGGSEQEDIARELSKKGYSAAVFGYSETSVDMSLKDRLDAVAQIREYSDPLKFESIYSDVLDNAGVTLSTFWSSEEIKGFDSQRKKNIENCVKEYVELKGLLKQVYNAEDKIMGFGNEGLSEFLEMSKIMGSDFADYNRFVTNALSFEMIEEFKKRKLSDAEKLDDEGDELNQLGRYKEALPFFDRSLKLSPKFCLAYINKGIALKNLGRFDEAIKCYDKVINEIDSNYKKAWHNKAVALEKKGDIKRAKECVAKALQIEPNYIHAQMLAKRLGLS